MPGKATRSLGRSNCDPDNWFRIHFRKDHFMHILFIKIYIPATYLQQGIRLPAFLFDLDSAANLFNLDLDLVSFIHQDLFLDGGRRAIGQGLGQGHIFFSRVAATTAACLLRPVGASLFLPRPHRCSPG